MYVSEQTSLSGTCTLEIIVEGHAITTESSTAVMRTFALAAQTLGGVTQLSERLRVSVEDLQRWISGNPPPPHNKFYLMALDIVSAGSLK